MQGAEATVRPVQWRAELRGQVGNFQLDVSLSGSSEAPTALVGPNGSGKTTVLRCLAGAWSPEFGIIEVGQQLLLRTPASRSQKRGDAVNVAPHKRRIGYVPQGGCLFPHLSVIDNVAFGLVVRSPRSPKRVRIERASALLKSMDCLHLAGRSVIGLSGGEQQRVVLARALMTEPDILLLDEPMAALDATSRRAVRQFLGNHLRDIGIPSIVVTHDVRDVQALEARAVVLEAGQVVQRGDLASLRRKPANDFVAEFV